MWLHYSYKKGRANTSGTSEDQRDDIATNMPPQVNCNLTPGCYHGTAEEKQRLMGVLERQSNTSFFLLGFPV